MEIDVNALAAAFGVSSAIISTIVGLVQLIKWWLKAKTDLLADKAKKTLDHLWVVIVGVLSVGAAAVLTAAQGWSWWVFIPLAFGYFVAAQGLYSSGKAILPLPPKG